jgi:hypothetical protein
VRMVTKMKMQFLKIPAKMLNSPNSKSLALS